MHRRLLEVMRADGDLLIRPNIEIGSDRAWFARQVGCRRRLEVALLGASPTPTGRAMLQVWTCPAWERYDCRRTYVLGVCARSRDETEMTAEPQ